MKYINHTHYLHLAYAIRAGSVILYIREVTHLKDILQEK